MANEYDKILKEIFGHAKTSLIKLLTEAEIISIKTLPPKVKQTTVEKEADTVAEVTTADGQNFLTHIGWQSANDATMHERMLFYNCLLRVRYQKGVLGAVVYVGNDALNMPDSITSFGLQYNFRVIDVRSLDPELFLSSDDPAQWIFAVLAGSNADKTLLIRKILHKLQVHLGDNPDNLSIKLKQMEVLSLLRGKAFQQKIIEEKNKMPITIDIKQDLRFNAGEEKGKLENRRETAERMIRKGSALSFVQEITALDMDTLISISNKVTKEK